LSGTIKIPDADFTSGISCSGVSEYVHLHGLDGLLLSVNNLADFLSGFPAENLFATTRTDLRGNIFHKDWFSVQLKDFAYKPFM